LHRPTAGEGIERSERGAAEHGTDMPGGVTWGSGGPIAEDAEREHAVQSAAWPAEGLTASRRDVNTQPGSAQLASIVVFSAGLAHLADRVGGFEGFERAGGEGHSAGRHSGFFGAELLPNYLASRDQKRTISSDYWGDFTRLSAT